ncbi:MAG: hypothetical protein JSU58_09435 [Dehalococcoidales bacterium]|nr:MAG: hypothetical protein JSU58_09435 [Dehalococcoidales bacterium]
MTNQSIKSILLIFGASGFSFNIGNIIHELGHAVADWMSGIPISNIHVIIHPFFAPHMHIEGGIPDSMTGWPDAAGPLANVTIGLIVFGILWKKRTPFTFPLLLWGPLACVQEGIGQMLTLSDRGSDAARMITAGLPEPLLILISILFVFSGIVLFGLVFPVAGISMNTPFFKRMGIIAAGMIPYGLLTLLICVLASPNQQDISRSYNIIGGFAIIAVIVAAAYSPVRSLILRFRIRTDFQVQWSHGIYAIGLLAVIVIPQLLFLNES